jgi:hypothetical protein
LDVPEAVREGASAANLRPIAWFELNKVDDPQGQRPQYLLAAARGAEGQSCDFSVLRVYTWNRKKSRYETAFIENDLCGSLPFAWESRQQDSRNSGLATRITAGTTGYTG